MNTILLDANASLVAEHEVLSVLRESEEDLAPSQLVEKVLHKSPQLDDVVVKRAVWQLLSRAQIRLSPDQRLSAPEEDDEQEVA